MQHTGCEQVDQNVEREREKKVDYQPFECTIDGAKKDLLDDLKRLVLFDGTVNRMQTSQKEEEIEDST